MDFIGASHPFYRPAYRRYIIVLTCSIWAFVEWVVVGDPFWAIIASGILGLAAYELLWTYNTKHSEKSDDKDNAPDAKP